MTFDIDQAGWGSSTFYPDDPTFTPRFVVVHWGGTTSQVTDEPLRLRIWQRYHINSRGWRDIAYNYAVGDSGTIYRCRGMNPGGHTSGVNDKTPEGDSYNDASIGVVWIGGANDTDGPSPAAYAAMARIVNGYVVKGHRTVKQENGSSTACPGTDWLDWIAKGGWEDMGKTTSNPAFQESWDKAIARGVYTEYTNPDDTVTAEKLAVFLNRAGLLNS